MMAVLLSSLPLLALLVVLVAVLVVLVVLVLVVAVDIAYLQVFVFHGVRGKTWRRRWCCCRWYWHSCL